MSFSVGEYDMVIYDRDNHSCKIYEIKHSDQIADGQVQHLVDKEKIEQTERRFGEITGRYVLYRGANANTEEGILYKNVAEYLKGLPDTAMTENVGQEIDDDGHSWGQKM